MPSHEQCFNLLREYITNEFPNYIVTPDALVMLERDNPSHIVKAVATFCKSLQLLKNVDDSNEESAFETQTTIMATHVGLARKNLPERLVAVNALKLYATITKNMRPETLAQDGIMDMFIVAALSLKSAEVKAQRVLTTCLNDPVGYLLVNMKYHPIQIVDTNVVNIVFKDALGLPDKALKNIEDLRKISLQFALDAEMEQERSIHMLTYCATAAIKEIVPSKNKLPRISDSKLKSLVNRYKKAYPYPRGYELTTRHMQTFRLKAYIDLRDEPFSEEGERKMDVDYLLSDKSNATRNKRIGDQFAHRDDPVAAQIHAFIRDLDQHGDKKANRWSANLLLVLKTV